jgi:erythromycin esterase-like protein
MSPPRPVGVVAGRAVQALRAAAVPLTGAPADFDPVLERVGNARLVLLGEATHGTHEFYRVRAQITKRLLVEKGFCGVAIEGDWPDAYRVNRYVRGRGRDADASEALSDFRRFPSWMWRNADVLDFVGWLRQHNDALPESERAGFYGLDLYSLHASMEAVLRYLDQVDPEAARRARARYRCFDRFGEDAQRYAQGTAFGVAPSCEDQVVSQLADLQAGLTRYASNDGRFMPDDHFQAEQNARLVRDAEEYYRTMFRGRVSSWNLRDRHMAESLDSLLGHLDRTGVRPARLVVWAHNSHLGDARATEMGDSGEWNVGQLVREWFPGQSLHVGFSTYRGTVTAADDWGRPARRLVVRPALPGSYESLFHAVGLPRFALATTTETGPTAPEPLLQRAIGVLYRPETERQSHYFEAHLSRQFDLLLHYDETRAVEPLERTGEWYEGEPAETYPTGM